MVFIGPPASAIRAMGDKAAAKRLMAKAGVPLVPGYDGANQHPAILADAANRLGYPVLIKAAAGGGGRGMRVVDAVAGFGEAAASAKREAKAAFGDGRLILERYLPHARHVEVQIFADAQGNFVHLFTRDCSLQRRHQKVIEEAPAPDLPPRLRASLHEAALKAARAVRYRGAGTVEFIVADGKAYFIEMNTRLQVEHPVTEIVTGFDLVEWQLRVAVGERLPRRQKAIKLRGHAVEARLYAEDPAAGFLPSTGTLGRLRFPPPAKDLRIETGLRQGDRVTEFYDPMIAKLAAWGRHRPAALARLAEALRETRVLGVQTNRDLLLRLVTQRPFVKGPADTGYIARHWAKLRPGPAPDAALAAAALSRLVVPLTPVRGGDGFSPWRLKDGWRIEGGSAQEFRFVEGGRERRVALRFGRAGLMLDFGQRRVPALAWKLDDGDLAFELGRLHFHASVSWHGAGVQIALAEGIFQLDLAAPRAARARRSRPGRSCWCWRRSRQRRRNDAAAQKGARGRGWAARRAAEREQDRADCGQGGAHRAARRCRGDGDRGRQLRVAEMGPADGGYRRSAESAEAPPGRDLSGAGAEHEGLRGGARRQGGGNRHLRRRVGTLFPPQHQLHHRRKHRALRAGDRGRQARGHARARLCLLCHRLPL